MVYADGKAFEVEFVSLTGETIALLTLDADAVRALRRREVAHVREMAWERPRLPRRPFARHMNTVNATRLPRPAPSARLPRDSWEGVP